MNKITDIKQIYQLWNDEYGFIYPITEELFKRNLDNSLDSACYVVIKDELIVGFIIGKIWQNKFEINNYKETGWISLIYVHPKYRCQGIGTRLLEQSIEALSKYGAKIINLGRDVHNFFPGLPVDLKNFLPWFQKRGFDYTYQTYDLITRNDKILLSINNKDFTFKIADYQDKENLIAFIGKNWPGRWTYEAVEYFENGGNGSEYLICLNKKKEICGFVKVCYNNTITSHMSNAITWRARFDSLGGIGPLGITPSYRGRHLGFDIVATAVNILKQSEVTNIIIDWTGLLEFYRKMGFEVWKSYFYLNKKI